MASFSPHERAFDRYKPTNDGQPSSPPSAFELSSIGLTKVTAGLADPSVLRVVAGETADDFALALALDRVYGGTLWLHPNWYPEAVDEVDKHHLRHALDLTTGRRHRIHLTSASHSKDDLEVIANEIRTMPPSFILLDESGNPLPSIERKPEIAVEPPSWVRQGKRHLGVIDEFDMAAALPAYLTDDGGIRLAAPPPSPRINSKEIVRSDAMLPSNGPHWQVDLQILPPTMPRARRLPREALLADSEESYLAWVRSGRSGVSFEPWSFGFVPAGSTIDQQLIRPLVKELGMADWGKAVATQSNCTTRASAIGRVARLLADKWGSREALIQDITTPLRSAIRDLHPSERSTRKSYPNDDGVRLRAGYGVMSYSGFYRHWPEGTPQEDVRDQLDRLTAIGALQRGLVLSCSECQELAFVALDALHQSNKCLRCGASTQLGRASWNSPVQEPSWFYDAHPSLRELIQQFGDAPLLLAHWLRRQAKQYSDSPEFELLNSNSAPIAEVDLLANIDNQVVVAEVKSAQAASSPATLATSSRERKAAARKRAESARILRADQVLLATTQAEWESSSIAVMKAAILNEDWSVSGRPDLRVITGLGTDECADRIVPVGEPY